MTGQTGLVGILGGTSPLAPFLLDLMDHESVARFSRATSHAHAGLPGASWSYEGCPPDLEVRAAISLMPVWELQHYFAWLRDHGCRRLVVLSSTSRFTKTSSSRPYDRELARRLADGESAVETWADEIGVSLTILRPTMVYGGPADGNVSEMAQLLRRFRAVPLVGSGSGLRQPVHMGDVAAAAASAVRMERTPRTAYDISGGEVLTYRQFLNRIRGTVDGPTFVLRVPGTPFRLLERTFPKSRRLSLAAGMVERMGTDMVFDHSAARADLGHDPRPFRPQPGHGPNSIRGGTR